MQTNPVKLNFSNEGSNGINTPEAYENSSMIAYREMQQTLLIGMK